MAIIMFGDGSVLDANDAGVTNGDVDVVDI